MSSDSPLGVFLSPFQIASRHDLAGSGFLGLWNRKPSSELLSFGSKWFQISVFPIRCSHDLKGSDIKRPQSRRLDAWNVLARLSSLLLITEMDGQSRGSSHDPPSLSAGAMVNVAMAWCLDVIIG